MVSSFPIKYYEFISSYMVLSNYFYLRAIIYFHTIIFQVFSSNTNSLQTDLFDPKTKQNRYYHFGSK